MITEFYNIFFLLQERAKTLASVDIAPPDNMNEILKLRPMEVVEFVKAAIEILLLFKKQTRKQRDH